MNTAVLSVPVRKLTPETFALFGVYVSRPQRNPDWGASGSRIGGVTEAQRTEGVEVARLWNLGDLAFEEQPYVGLVTYFNQGFRVAQLERHVNETQTWIARSGSGYLVVAPRTSPGRPPGPESAQAFLVEPGDVIAIGKGVWMCHFFPIAETAEYAVVTARRAPEQDRDLVDFVKTSNTVLEITPGQP
jgi:ureidoglycolate hydrolase